MMCVCVCVCVCGVGILVFIRSSEGQVPRDLSLSPGQLEGRKQQNLHFPSCPFEFLS